MHLRKTLFFLAMCVMVTISCTVNKTSIKKKNEFDTVFAVAQKQYEKMLIETVNLTKYPRTANLDGSVHYVTIKDWTGGFWPGILWYMYEYNKVAKWKESAILWTESLENNQFNTSHHDLGFMMYNSYGIAHRLFPNQQYENVLIQSAKSLITRYNPVVKSIKSWNTTKSWNDTIVWHFPVIIDNMMNLELLFFASAITGDSIYKHIAIQHAETTMKNHIRNDYSSYHVVDYDSTTGKVLHKQTAQGYADNSTWARGQAWGIYGFTQMYKFTKDKRYLKTAQKMADFYLHHPNLPSDKIPYWDFNAGKKGYRPDWKRASPATLNYTPRDASAAAITASALLMMANYLEKDGDKYRSFAIEILRSLSSPKYLAVPGTNSNFLLKHSTGSIPHNFEIDVPLVYADYYYLEAILRYSGKLK